MMYDLVIVGGGAAGVAAGVYAARKKLKTALLTDRFGGQSLVSADIKNWIGTPSLSGLELAERLEGHLRAQEGIEIVEGDMVVSVTRQGDGFTVATAGGKTFSAAAVLIATGSRRRKLGVPGEQQFEGRGVVYCATCDAPLFGGKAVAVVGGGNAGLEAVRDLLPYASRIYLLERAAALSGDAVTQENVRVHPAVQIILNAEVEEIMGNKMVEKIRVRDVTNGAVSELAVAGVFAEIGLVPNSELAQGLAEVNGHGEIIVDPRTQTTSCPGVWAAGDATDGRYRQNNISAGDAVKAVLSICDFLSRRTAQGSPEAVDSR